MVAPNQLQLQPFNVTAHNNMQAPQFVSVPQQYVGAGTFIDIHKIMKVSVAVTIRLEVIGLAQ